MKKKVMVLCTGNSCRSQMAEGFLRAMGGGSIEAHSAGLVPAGVNPYAIRVMAEAGMDISSQRSKPMDAALLATMDVVITVCGNAEAACPSAPTGVRRLHIPIDDPVHASGSDEEIMQAFRRARDEIRLRMAGVLEGLGIRAR